MALLITSDPILKLYNTFGIAICNFSVILFLNVSGLVVT